MTLSTGLLFLQTEQTFWLREIRDSVFDMTRHRIASVTHFIPSSFQMSLRIKLDHLITSNTNRWFKLGRILQFIIHEIMPGRCVSNKGLNILIPAEYAPLVAALLTIFPMDTRVVSFFVMVGANGVAFVVAKTAYLSESTLDVFIFIVADCTIATIGHGKRTIAFSADAAIRF